MFCAAFLLAAVGSLLALASAHTITDPICLYNATHCACRQSTSPGNCLRKDSGTRTDSMCKVSTCNAGSYSCDCLGTNVCKIITCSNWAPKDGTIASRLEKDTTVACVQKTDAKCLSKVEMPVEYKMVQFGAATGNNVAGTMFNMSFLTVSDDLIAKSYKLSDKWDHHDTLRFRHITMRMYESDSSGDKMLCGIYNTYGLPNDGLGFMRVTVTIKGLSGQQLSWVACDDSSECTGGPSSTLTAAHKLVFTHSDGWCVKPMGADVGAISVKFTDVVGFEGVSFHLSDGMEDSYYFFDGEKYGMAGTVNDNGLVSSGEVPEILFNLAGAEVPR